VVKPHIPFSKFSHQNVYTYWLSADMITSVMGSIGLRLNVHGKVGSFVMFFMVMNFVKRHVETNSITADHYGLFYKIHISTRSVTMPSIFMAW